MGREAFQECLNNPQVGNIITSSPVTKFECSNNMAVVIKECGLASTP